MLCRTFSLLSHDIGVINFILCSVHFSPSRQYTEYARETETVNDGERKNVLFMVTRNLWVISLHFRFFRINVFDFYLIRVVFICYCRFIFYLFDYQYQAETYINVQALNMQLTWAHVSRTDQKTVFPNRHHFASAKEANSCTSCASIPPDYPD